MRGLRRASTCGAAMAAVGVLLAGCSGGAPAVEPSSGAPSSEPTESASPTESATPTETESEVLPANDVEDPREALQAIWDYYDYMLANPTSGDLSRIFDPECECYQLAQDVLAGMAERGEWIRVEGRSIQEARVVDRTQTVAQVSFRNVADSLTVIRADGSEGDSQPLDVQTGWVLVFQGGRWVVRQDV